MPSSPLLDCILHGLTVVLLSFGIGKEKMSRAQVARSMAVALAFLMVLFGHIDAYQIPTERQATTTPLPPSQKHENGDWMRKLPVQCASMVATAALAWGANFGLPAIDSSTTATNHFHMSVFSTIPVAQAKEKASGSGSRVNKDPESLLRYGLPIQNKEVRSLQEVLENIKYDIGSKRKSAALDGAKKAKTYLSGKTANAMIGACQDAKVCQSYVQQMDNDITPLSNALKASQEALQGSEQERTALDQAYAAQEELTKTLTALEEQMIPSNYVTPVPKDYSDLPQLTKRATVEMKFKKEGNAPFNVNGVNYPEAKMVMVIDGYTAPVTGGNFVDLVQKGFYNGMHIQRSDGFVVQTGQPEGDAKAIGYVGTPSKSIGAGPNGERLIPTEIFVRGDKGPFYETTIEDEGRGGESTVLPFSAYGAMGWARDEYDPNSGSSQFFWLLFDSDLTPAGKNVLDGRYPCFGYVVEGADFLQDLKEGDLIVSAKVTSGSENLKQP